MEYSIPWLDRRAEERKNTTVVERQRCMSWEYKWIAKLVGTEIINIVAYVQNIFTKALHRMAFFLLEHGKASIWLSLVP